MNRDILEEYKNKSLLRSQSHPTLPLQIWNYTEKVQYDDLWDDRNQVVNHARKLGFNVFQVNEGDF